MNRWRRAHKAYVNRQIVRLRRIERAIRGVQASAAVMSALAQIQMLRSTPASHFGGPTQKMMAIAEVSMRSVINVAGIYNVQMVKATLAMQRFAATMEQLKGATGEDRTAKPVS